MNAPRQIPASIQREAEQLARLHSVFADEITSVHVNDRGELSAVGLGADSDGLARFALNFDL